MEFRSTKMKGQGSAFNQAGTILFLSKGTKTVSANYIFMYENPHMIVSESVRWVNENVSVVNLAIFL